MKKIFTYWLCRWQENWRNFFHVLCKQLMDRGGGRRRNGRREINTSFSVQTRNRRGETALPVSRPGERTNSGKESSQEESHSFWRQLCYNALLYLQIQWNCCIVLWFCHSPTVQKNQPTKQKKTLQDYIFLSTTFCCILW